MGFWGSVADVFNGVGKVIVGANIGAGAGFVSGGIPGAITGGIAGAGKGIEASIRGKGYGDVAEGSAQFGAITGGVAGLTAGAPAAVGTAGKVGGAGSSLTRGFAQGGAVGIARTAITAASAPTFGSWGANIGNLFRGFTTGVSQLTIPLPNLSPGNSFGVSLPSGALPALPASVGIPAIQTNYPGAPAGGLEVQSGPGTLPQAPGAQVVIPPAPASPAAPVSSGLNPLWILAAFLAVLLFLRKRRK